MLPGKKRLESGQSKSGPNGEFKDSGDILLGFTGNIHNIYWPNLKNRDNCKATVVHTGAWPEGLDVTGKKVAIKGNGASAVQVSVFLHCLVCLVGTDSRTHL